MNTKKGKPTAEAAAHEVRDGVAADWTFGKTDAISVGHKVSEYSLALGSRIRQSRGEASRDDFARELGLHSNTVGKFERGESMPDAQTLMMIAQLGKRSAQWLLTGEPENSYADAEFVIVTGVGVTASAGPGALVDDENEVGRFAFRRTWLQQRGLPTKGLRVVTAKGDSMEPTVKNGDVLLVDTAVERLSADGIYLIEHGNELRCKRLQLMVGGGVTIRSDNRRYEPEIVPPGQTDQLRVVAKVVWIGGER